MLAVLAQGDLVGFTFLLGTLAMFGASIFFFFERRQVAEQWKTSLLVAAVVTTIATANYAFMSYLWITAHVAPNEFRYLDWLLTVPLICLQFYLLLDAAGARPSSGLLWRLVSASLWMLIAGYIGQSIDPQQTILWGAVSTLGYAVLLFEISLGEVDRLSSSADHPASSSAGTGRVKRTFDLLFRFLFIGWAIYPLGYMTMPGNLLSALRPVLNLEVCYNLGDAINKIGFGLVVWNLARTRGIEPVAPPPVEGRAKALGLG